MGTASGSKGDLKKDQSSEQNIRESNIVAGRAIADTLRTSLGPRGMDKMITSPSGDVTITNDGATILEQLQLQHPAAKIVCSSVLFFCCFHTPIHLIMSLIFTPSFYFISFIAPPSPPTDGRTWEIAGH